MEHIAQMIQNDQWEEAALAIMNKLESDTYDDTLAVLAATVNEHFGDTETFLLNIETGLKYNYQNYELYLMLGNYYAGFNSNQAFLCYENAEYYCKLNGSEEDLAYICQIKQTFEDTHNITVRPYSFVILSYNTLDLTRDCIESIRRNCNLDTYELIVIDNASKDGSVEWLREQKDIILIENTENVGFPAGCNQGINVATLQNDIMLLNSDTIMMPNAMFTLRMGLYDSEQNGMAGSVTNYAANNQVIERTFDGVEEYRQYAMKNNVPGEHKYEYKVWLVGFALLMKRTALNQVGMLDERFTPGNYEDNDLGIRFLQKGFRNVLCWNSFIFHWGNKSFKQAGARSYENIMQINREKYKEKWGISPTYYMYARTDLMQLMQHDSKSSIRVLEIGCGAGVTLGRIQYCYPNAEVYGIELVDEVASLGAVNFDIICGNIESMDLPYEQEYFDYIIFGDVLEHLVNPALVLEKVRTYLKKGGYVLASIPNLMNAEVIYSLLQGRFPYEEAGIRDETHLRFFTYQEIIKLFEKTGYRIEAVMAILLEGRTTDTYKKFFEQLLAIEGVADREFFDAYQYLVRARSC